MSLFGHKKEDTKPKDSDMPSLPRLPELPPIQTSNRPLRNPEVHQLPSLPPSSFSDRLSQNMIKEAVTGKRGDGDLDESLHEKIGLRDNDYEEVEDLEDLDEEESFAPSARPLSKKKRAFEIPSEFRDAAEKINEAEPVYIRIDKFQESLNLFKKVKTKISEIDDLLKETKNIKDEEEKELQDWEEELMKMKDQIAKIDKDIFSKV